MRSGGIRHRGDDHDTKWELQICDTQGNNEDGGSERPLTALVACRAGVVLDVALAAARRGKVRGSSRGAWIVHAS